MSEKIYCEYCRFCEKGLCHRVPPQVIFVSGGCRESNFPHVTPNCWCGAAESRKKVEDADCPRDEIAKMQAENKNLRGLITEIREFLIGGAIPGHVHLKQEYIREIYAIASEEDEKRRNEK